MRKNRKIPFYEKIADLLFSKLQDADENCSPNLIYYRRKETYFDYDKLVEMLNQDGSFSRFVGEFAAIENGIEFIFKKNE